MESANYNLHHQLQSGQLASSSSSSLSTPPSTYATSPPTWPQNYTLNNTVGLNPRQKHEISNPHFNNLMIQDLGNFHWNTNNILNHNDQQQIGKIKEELSSESFPKFTEMLNRSTLSNEDSNFLSSTNYIKDDQQQKYMNDLSEKLLLKTISSGFPINGNQFSPYHNCSSYGRGGNFSQIYPSINISNLNRSLPPPQISLGAFDMNLQALDLLTSTRFSGNFEQPFHDYLGNVMQPSTRHIPSCNPSKITSSAAFTTNDQITEAKRPSNTFVEPKPTQSAPKKSRLDSRASCSPFKVRKEKLGDRIAALQQLVAPFGKTDTASVLMEAIGYIKFLQNQVETLSVPYMKSSRNKNSRTTQAFQGSAMEEGNDERKRDLRSRGLCLVPVSCMSYVAGDSGGGSGGGIWPPDPNFSGGT